MASNRDEVYRAPAQALGWRVMNGEPLLCGLDVRSGGTWMVMSSTGRFGAVTNVRRGLPTSGTATRSRGALLPEFAAGSATPQEYAAKVAADGGAFGGFNLLIGDVRESALWWSSNRSDGRSTAVAPGVHGLSNAVGLDALWPKVAGGVDDFTKVLEADDGSERSVTRYLDVLSERSMAPRRNLPDTGVGLVLEKCLSPRFVRMGFYGTRCSTVLRIRHDGVFDMVERRFDRLGRHRGDSRIMGELSKQA